MMQQGVEKSARITLHWAGDLTIRRVAELKAEVQGALQSATGVSIVIAPEAECDVTLLQLLCAAHRTASQTGKTLEIRGEIPGQFKTIMTLAGFSRHVGCAQVTSGGCLWKGITQHSSGGEKGRAPAPASSSH